MGTQKLPLLSGPEICKILLKDGFNVVSQKGSHIKLKKKSTPEKVITVIVPNHNPVKRGMLKAIIKQAGLDREEFLEILKKN